MSDTFDRVLRCMHEVFRGIQRTPPQIGLDSKLDASLGLESLDYAELVVRLEEEFDFDPFAEGIPPGLETVGGLVALYDKR